MSIVKTIGEYLVASIVGGIVVWIALWALLG